MTFCLSLRRLSLRLSGCALAFAAAWLPSVAHAQPLLADDALLAMREATFRGDLQEAASYMPILKTHPLYPYAEYWMLLARLTNERLPAPTARELNDFAQRYAGDYLLERVRHDWLRFAGKQGDWAQFDPQYAAWVFKDDAEVECYALLSRHLKGQNVAQPAKQAVLAGQGTEGCYTLADHVYQRGDWQRADAVEVTRRLAEDGAFDASRRFAMLFLDGASLRRLDAAWRNPVRFLARQVQSGNDEREIAMLALLRAVRNDPLVACALLTGSLGERFTAADQRQARANCAMWAVRKHLPQALDWHRAIQDQPLTESGYAWAVRAALRGGESGKPAWPMVLGFIDRMPQTQQREETWVYWRGRALQALNRQEEAVAAFESIADQFSFYGQLAAEELSRSTVIPPLPPVPTEQELRNVRTRPGILRALKFYELDLRTEAQREWNYAIRGMSDRELIAAAQVAYQAEVYDRTVNTSAKTQAVHDFRQRFVMPFKSVVSAKARDAGLDEAWVYGLIRQESRFMLSARSGVGASGLMQVMPATARWVARKVGMTNVLPRLHDLDVNIALGTQYLKLVLEDLGNSPLLASAAYNAGPNRALRWRASLVGPMEGAIFAESIPFEETRDYAKRVLSNATYYAALMTGRPQSLKARVGMVSPSADTETELP